MSLNFSIDLSEATFGDLEALVDAARAVGVDKRAPLDLEGETLTLEAEARTPGRPAPAPREPKQPQLGDAAIRSVIDILSGRLDPPR